ncbi:BQ5605_C016g08111 [Microbotryum silenes-dioicae]|uniref:BQ5605_C016g08111 protein n=1 Tax=Microbotryum silenes-dioicae TaxID=796604 RepID=A0A2X0NZE1_9BASI|nr:BQ5605_C016g08111 [Microbotryum silenes-dioicae]
MNTKSATELKKEVRSQADSIIQFLHEANLRLVRACHTAQIGALTTELLFSPFCPNQPECGRPIVVSRVCGSESFRGALPILFKCNTTNTSGTTVSVPPGLVSIPHLNLQPCRAYTATNVSIK